MKIRKIAVLCMAVAFAMPVFSQENIVKAFERLGKRVDLITGENHVKDIDKVTGEVNSTTDVYVFSLGKEDVHMIDAVKRVFAKDRESAVKMYSSTGAGFLKSPHSVISVGSGDLKINVGSHDPKSSYMVMVFPDVKDTTRNRRYVYAMEWKEDSKGGAEMSLIADHGVKPEAKKVPNVTFVGNPKWDAEWIYEFNMYLKNMKKYLPRINKGELTVFPTAIYQQCQQCPVKDVEMRKSCADELRTVAEKFSSDAKVERDLLLRAAAALEK